MKYGTILFDMDGTILDSQPGIVRGLQLALKKYGIVESDEAIRGLIGPPLSKTVLTRYGLTEARRDEIMAEFRRYQFARGMLDCRVYDGVREMLKSLREAGLKLGIATNKPADMHAAQMEHFQLVEFFDAVEANNPAQTRGTKSDFVRWAMEGCGATPDNTLMVGDRAGDIQGGKDNGMDTMGVLYGYGSAEELNGCRPTYIAETPEQATEIILHC